MSEFNDFEAKEFRIASNTPEARNGRLISYVVVVLLLLALAITGILKYIL